MSKIEWTNRTWNPVTGCNKVSQGCKNCYAEIMHRRLRGMFPYKYSKPFLDGVEVHEAELAKPLWWKKPSMIFVNSMSDLFHKDVPVWFIAEVFAIMYLANWHTYQVLTKRADFMLLVLTSEEFKVEFHKAINRLHDKYIEPLEQEMWQYVEAVDALPLANVWIGVSVENQDAADARIPQLLETPAAIRFLSCEPLLGPINITDWLYPKQVIERVNRSNDDLDLQNEIHWVITGGESGNNARHVDANWVRLLKHQCTDAGVPFFFKQWGQWLPLAQLDASGTMTVRFTGKNKTPERFYKVGKKKSGNFLDGKQYLEFPKSLTTSK